MFFLLRFIKILHIRNQSQTNETSNKQQIEENEILSMSTHTALFSFKTVSSNLWGQKNESQNRTSNVNEKISKISSC